MKKKTDFTQFFAGMAIGLAARVIGALVGGAILLGSRSDPATVKALLLLLVLLLLFIGYSFGILRSEAKP